MFLSSFSPVSGRNISEIQNGPASDLFWGHGNVLEFSGGMASDLIGQ